MAMGAGMDAALLATLPVAHRLALAYAPARAQAATLALLALDARLAAIVRAGGEPVIAQLKLAWWRERMGERLADWPEGEPLLACLRAAGLAPGGLAPLVDGWEALLGERLDNAAINDFGEGRVRGWLAAAKAIGADTTSGRAEAAARRWALADLARNLGDQSEAATVREAAFALPQSCRLPRALRPLAVLEGLSLRALRRGTGDVLDGPVAMLLAMRLGIAGR